MTPGALLPPPIDFRPGELAADEAFIDDDEQDDEDFYAAPSTFQGFTFNPVSAGQTLTESEKKIQIASLVTEYGILKDKDAKLRFIIGVMEKRKPPGKGVGEVDKYKREWNKLREFTSNHNWRRILSNEFEGDMFDTAMPFTIDGYEWMSVYHYLVGMLYNRTPAYAVMFSMNSKEDANGYWAKVKAAKRVHERNIIYGAYPIDTEYAQKIDTYLSQAYLAKFTQNPLAKTALLLTEDAVLSIRAMAGILDLPILMKVRDHIKANPNIVYRGASVQVERVEEQSPIITNPEELNHGYVDLDARGGRPKLASGALAERNDLIAGTILPSSLYVNRSADSVIRELGIIGSVERESIVEGECVIYLATGAYAVDVKGLIGTYGHPKFIRRHLYAMERVAYDANAQLFVGFQRTPVSQMSEYVLINTEIGSDRIPVSIYLEPFESGYGIFVISAGKSNTVLEFLRYLTQQASFVNATV